MRQTPCRRRTGVRRLRRRRVRDRRPATGEIREAEIFVARAGRLEPHLRRGDLDAAAAGLDRRPCARLRGLSAACRTARSRQPEERASSRPASTIPRSTAPMARWRRITDRILPARPRKPRDKAKASYCTLSGLMASVMREIRAARGLRPPHPLAIARFADTSQRPRWRLSL